MPSSSAAAKAKYDEAALARLAHLNECTVNQYFWTRSWRIMRIGLGTPFQEPKLWLLVLVNLAVQILAGYDAQSHFYYTGTGTGSSDPGMAGCLKKTSNQCSNSQYEVYFIKFAWTFALLVCGVAFFSVSGDIINVWMRKRLNAYLQQRLLDKNTLYRLQLDGRIDNFDQRITSDLQASLDGLCCAFFGNTSDYLAYPIGFCVSRMGFAFANTLYPPGSAVTLDSEKQAQILLSVFVMAVVTMIAYVLPMNQISRIFFLGQEYEGDFRTTHTRTIINSESIAFYNGEKREQVHADEQFARVYYNNLRYYKWQGSLMFLRLVVIISQPSIGYMMLAITGANNNSYASAFLKQIGNVMEYLLNLPAIMARLAFAAGAAHRVGQLMEVLDELQATHLESIATELNGVDFIELIDVTANPPIGHKYVEKTGCCFGFFRRTTPNTNELEMNAMNNDNSRPRLFQSLNLRINHGESVVIMGPSGCGKSSLLRVIGGLWTIEAGTVIRPDKTGRDGLFFLPQRSYVFPGSLLAQVTYPLPPIADTNSEEGQIQRQQVIDLLKTCNLSNIVNEYGLEDEIDWTIVLSASERQRLSFARVFYNQPLFCLADEATSAMDLMAEDMILKECKQRGISLISVAHRPSVAHHHDKVLEYKASINQWTLEPVVKSEDAGHLTEEIEDHSHNPTSTITPQYSDHSSHLGLGKRFWQRLWAAIRMVIPSWNSPGAMLLLIMLIAMSVDGIIRIIVFKYFKTDEIIRDVLAGNRSSAFNMAGIHIVINLISSVAQTISAFCGVMFGMYFQREFITRVHAAYFDRNVAYMMNKLEPLEGIDQRIVADLNGWRESFSWLLGNPFAYLQFRLGFIPLSISFTIMLVYAFTIAWSLTVFFLGSLVFALICQILFGFLTSTALESRQYEEGQLRLHYGRIKNSIESITFFGGQLQELQTATLLLNSTVKSRLHYVIRASLIVVPTVASYYWLSNGDYLMAAILQIYTPSNLPPADMFTILTFCVLMGKLGEQMVQSLGGLGMLAGYTHRASEVLDRAFAVQAKAQQALKTHENSETEMSIADVDVAIQAQKLINKLSMSVGVNDSMVIMGPSACGKSSITRVLAGLWPSSNGSVRRPAQVGQNGIFFVPQTNYITEGTLRQQIIYPHIESTVSDKELQALMDEVGLGYIADRWGFEQEVTWEDVLSGGEAQRLGFVRMFYHSPRFAVLDETTSALDMPLEKKCMEACQNRGITMLSIATRLSQKKYHKRLMQLNGKGDYTIESLDA